MSYRTYTVHELAKDGKLSILKQILDDKPELLNERDSKDLHCLHIAAYTGDLAVANELIRRGANKDLLRADGMSPMLIAAMRGTPPHAALVVALAKQGANVNLQGPMGYTVLHFLCMKGLLDAVRALLQPAVGAMINRRTNEQSTPLHAAVTGNHLELALLLIKEGADKNAQNKQGKTPLMCLKGKEGEANRRAVLEALER